MSLFEQEAFDAFILTLAGTFLLDQWESRVAKVGDKVFALMRPDRNPNRIVFKVTEESFEILTALDGITQAPYFAKRMWVSVEEGAPLSQEDLQYYITRSHALVAAGLTRKRSLELGIAI